MRHRSVEPAPKTGVGSVSITEVMTMRNSVAGWDWDHGHVVMPNAKD